MVAAMSLTGIPRAEARARSMNIRYSGFVISIETLTFLIPRDGQIDFSRVEGDVKISRGVYCTQNCLLSGAFVRLLVRGCGSLLDRSIDIELIPTFRSSREEPWAVVTDAVDSGLDMLGKGGLRFRLHGTLDNYKVSSPVSSVLQGIAGFFKPSPRKDSPPENP